MKPLIQAAPVSSSVSWWLTAKRESFTETVVKEQQTRMSASTLGKGRNRPISSDEISR